MKKSKNEHTLSIGQVAEQTGLSIHTLRLYEGKGLLTGPVKRGTNGHRLYSPWDVEWLLNCTKFRASGMPLARIRDLATLVGQGSGNEQARLALLREHQQLIKNKMAELSDCLKLINFKVRTYEAHLSRGTAQGVWSPESENLGHFTHGRV
jgi:DNA-binding transcriptional MerR regulator